MANNTKLINQIVEAKFKTLNLLYDDTHSYRRKVICESDCWKIRNDLKYKIEQIENVQAELATMRREFDGSEVKDVKYERKVLLGKAMIEEYDLMKIEKQAVDLVYEQETGVIYTPRSKSQPSVNTMTVEADQVLNFKAS